jgi:hypothetical protein
LCFVAGVTDFLKLLSTVSSILPSRSEDFSDHNPVDRLDFADIHRKEVQVIPIPVVERMLLDALQHDLELLGFLVLGFYAGIRPNGELRKIHLGKTSP